MVITTLLYIDGLPGISNRKTNYTHTAKHPGTTVPKWWLHAAIELVALHVDKGGVLPPEFSSPAPTHRLWCTLQLVTSLQVMSHEWILNHLVHVNPMTGKQQAPAVKQVNTRWLLSRQHINEDKTAASPIRSKSVSSRLICLPAKNEWPSTCSSGANKETYKTKKSPYRLRRYTWKEIRGLLLSAASPSRPYVLRRQNQKPYLHGLTAQVQ